MEINSIMQAEDEVQVGLSLTIGFATVAQAKEFAAQVQRGDKETLETVALLLADEA